MCEWFREMCSKTKLKISFWIFKGDMEKGFLSILSNTTEKNYGSWWEFWNIDFVLL